MRRRKQVAEQDAFDGDDDLTVSLLGGDGAADEPPRTSGRDSNHRPEQQQLIVWQQFNLHSFLSYIYNCWRSVTGAVATLLASYLPASRSRDQSFHQSQPSTTEPLSLLQAQRLDSLRQRIAVSYDTQDPQHQDLLRKLWHVTFPGLPCTALKTSQWKEMGWQGDDPATDFRGAGLFGLQNLLYFAEQQPEAYRRLVHKSNGTRAEWEYPFAVAGLNLTVMLVDLLHLKEVARGPLGPAARSFQQLLSDDSASSFEEVYCASFEVLDAKWLAMKADYMQFNAVLKATRQLVESALGGRVQDAADARRRVLAMAQL